MTTYGPYPGIVLDWHDGDTCHVDVDLGFGFRLCAFSLGGRPQVSCRVLGIDAPELTVMADGDKMTTKRVPNPAGLASRDAARKLCPPGTWVTVYSEGWDEYRGRFDGRLILPDGGDFAHLMLAAGQAVPKSS